MFIRWNSQEISSNPIERVEMSGWKISQNPMHSSNSIQKLSTSDSRSGQSMCSRVFSRRSKVDLEVLNLELQVAIDLLITI
jgi:hypothetical protein